MVKKGIRRKNRKGDRFPSTERKADGMTGKRVPNSLIATLRGIRRRWGVASTDEQSRTPKEFASLFAPSFAKVVALYPAFRDEANNLPKFVESIEGAGKHTREISYYHIRAYAEHVGLPVGLLMLFSHILGDATRGFSRDEIYDLIDSSVTSLNALREFLEEQNEICGALFREKLNDGLLPRYNAKMEGLRRMQAAFFARRKTPERQPPDLVG